MKARGLLCARLPDALGQVKGFQGRIKGMPTNARCMGFHGKDKCLTKHQVPSKLGGSQEFEEIRDSWRSRH